MYLRLHSQQPEVQTMHACMTMLTTLSPQLQGQIQARTHAHTPTCTGDHSQCSFC